MPTFRVQQSQNNVQLHVLYFVRFQGLRQLRILTGERLHGDQYTPKFMDTGLVSHLPITK